MKEKIPFYNSLVLPYHFGKSVFWGNRYGWPGRKLRVIGVTGTNGKTTTCFMIWKMLNASGRKCGLMSTVAWGVGKLESQVEHMTTVDAAELNQRIEKIAKEKARFLVLELTSHALAQFRAIGVPIEIAVMTNVTHEHLDYHGSFERYRDAKRKLFRKAKFGVINADDKSAKWFKQSVSKYITYGINDGDLRATEVRLQPDGVKYACGDINIRTKIPGVFNVYNSLAAVAVGKQLGLSDKEIEDGIYALASVNGRMERISEGQDFDVIVDYAHTPDAMEKVYESIGNVKGRVITLFGGAGRRDIPGRGMRGEVAAKYSDLLIVTEDDSRDEPVEEILEQIARGAEKGGMVRGKNLWLVPERRRAIAEALGMARRGDMVLVLGKGHELTILKEGKMIPFYDPKVAAEELRKLLKKK